MVEKQLHLCGMIFLWKYKLFIGHGSPVVLDDSYTHNIYSIILKESDNNCTRR